MSTASPPLETPVSRRIIEPRSLFASRRGRILRENLTAYLFLLPAALIIFTFGIFPVGFALYVSLHRWRLVPGEFKGLGNYTKAIGGLAYVAAFWLAVGALVGVVLLARRVLRVARERGDRLTLWLLPGAVSAGGVLLFMRFIVLWLPEVLGVAEKLKGQERTQELILRLFGETFQVPVVSEALWSSLAILAAGLVLGALVGRVSSGKKAGFYYANLSLIIGLLATGVLLFAFTLGYVQVEYVKAAEEGIELSIWSQIVTISAGAVLLGLAWLVWNRAAGQSSNARTVLIMTAAIMLMVGAWILIGELPRIVEEGDEDLFQGFVVTAFYSLGTVPFQLVISLFLAYLLFQNIRGQAFFRIVYFLPYVTPAVASAAVFRIIFSNRPTAPANQIFQALGMEPQQWLLEPRGIFQMLAEGAGVTIPAGVAGPSLALVVIILFSIWTYVGYDTVIFLAGLGAIPGELYEAAKIDGGGRWALFRHITLPLISPTTFFLTLIAIIGTFKAFNHIWILRHASALGTTDTASIVIFREFFENSRLGYASAMAFVLFAVILSLTLVQNRVAGRRVFYG
jgi:ABC-type sugar transport system permease subunit